MAPEHTTHTVIAQWAIVAVMLLALAAISPMCLDEGGREEKHLSGWSDLSVFKVILKGKVGVDWEEVESPSDALQDGGGTATLLVIVGIMAEMDERDVTAIYDFIHAGGKALIASESPNINALSSPFGVHCYGHRILSENFDKNVSFVRGEGDIGKKTYSLLYNSPSGFYVAHEAEGLDYTYISNLTTPMGMVTAVDYNDNGIMDGDEWPKQVPVPAGIMVRVNDSGGMSVFISNSGIFVDDMIGRYDNRAFISAILDTLLTPTYTKVLYCTGYQSGRVSGYIHYGD